MDELLKLIQSYSLFPATKDLAIPAGMSKDGLRGGLMEATGADKPESTGPSSFMSVIGALSDPKLQKLLNPEQMQLPGGGVGRLDLQGLVAPYQPPPVSNMLGLFGGR